MTPATAKVLGMMKATPSCVTVDTIPLLHISASDL
jgi:hypothetical protein